MFRILKRVPRVVSVGAIVGTAAVAAWLLVHAREDPPRGDRGPVALPESDAQPDAGSDARTDVVIDAP